MNHTSTHTFTPKLVSGAALTILVCSALLATFTDSKPQNTVVSPTSFTEAATPSTDTQTNSLDAAKQSSENNTVTDTNLSQDNTDTPTTSPQQPAPVKTPVATSPKNISRTVSYKVPKDHTNSINFTITTVDNVVTQLSLDGSFSDDESSEYVTRFKSNIGNYVVGKPVNEISSARIGGASLTSAAFFSALDSL